MKTKAHLVGAMLAVILMIAGTAHASTSIRYELTGNLTADLDGVPLKDNSFDIVFVGDTTTSAPDPNGVAIRNLVTSTSIRLSGYGAGQFLPASFPGTLGIATSPSVGGIAFFYETAGFTFQIIGITHSSLQSWDLVSALGPITPNLSVLQVRDGSTVQTTFGALRITGATNLTFTASIGGDAGDQARNSVFAEFADGRFPDGSSFRSTFLVSSDNSSTTDCTADLFGFTVPGFGTGSSRTFTLTRGGYSIMPTPGSQALRFGYATLKCTNPVSAQVLYSYYSATGALLSEATVFPSPAATTAQLLADQRNGARLAIAIANTASTSTDFLISAIDDNDNEVNKTTMQIPARSQVAGFLNEMMSLPSGFVGRVLITTKPSIFGGVYAIGFRFTGQVFTTIPVTSITYR